MLWKILLSAGVLAALILAAGWVRYRLYLPLRGSRLYTVLLAQGTGAGLEAQVRGYCLLRSWGLLRTPLILADTGLTEEGRSLAEALSRLDAHILLCGAEALPEIIREGTLAQYAERIQNGE